MQFFVRSAFGNIYKILLQFHVPVDLQYYADNVRSEIKSVGLILV